MNLQITQSLMISHKRLCIKQSQPLLCINIFMYLLHLLSFLNLQICLSNQGWKMEQESCQHLPRSRLSHGFPAPWLVFPKANKVTHFTLFIHNVPMPSDASTHKYTSPSCHQMETKGLQTVTTTQQDFELQISTCKYF